MKENLVIPSVFGVLAAYVYQFSHSLILVLILAGLASSFAIRSNRLSQCVYSSIPAALVLGLSFATSFELFYPDSHSAFIRTLLPFSLVGAVLSFAGLIIGMILRGIWERNSVSASNK